MSYINNQELIAEVWKSKLSYCDIVDHNHLTPDVIVDSTFNPNEPRNISVRVVRTLEEITEPDLTIRVDTHDHIPRASTIGKGRLGHLEGGINFEPFILYRSYRHGDEIVFREIARSHYKNGVFKPDAGRLTPRLGRLILLMTDKFGHKLSWRNYSYIDDLKLEAVLNLTQNVLKFNDAKTKNAHAYITRCIETTFIRELKRQKKHSKIRDAVLVDNGMMPSFGAQVDHEMSNADYE